MKRILIVILLFILVVSCCTCGVLYIQYCTRNLNESINLAITHAKENNFEQATKQLTKTDEQWKKYRTILMIYIEQDLLDEVDNQLIMLRATIQYHREEFLPQAILLLSHVEELKQRETITFRSWF